MANSSRKKKMICKLELEGNVVIENEERIVSEIYNFLSSLYSSGSRERPLLERLSWFPICESSEAF